MGEGTDLSFDETRAWLQRMREELGEHGASVSGEPTLSAAEARLRLGEVTVTVERSGLKASVTLCHGEAHYRGVCEDRAARKHGWLVAAATVSAVNTFMSVSSEEGASRSVELLSAGEVVLPAGEVAAVATVEFAHHGVRERLLGAVLMLQRPLEAQAAAVLDAVNRRLGRAAS